MKSTFTKIMVLLTMATLSMPFTANSQQARRNNSKSPMGNYAFAIDLIGTDNYSSFPNPAVGTIQNPTNTIDCNVCELPDQVFVVDASTGKYYWHESATLAEVDKLKFKTGEKITVVLINKNPFLYKYDVQITAVDISGYDLIPVFLKSLSGIFDITLPDAPTLDSLVATGQPTVAKCKPESPEAMAAKKLFDALNEQHKQLQGKIDGANDQYGKFQKAYKTLTDTLMTYRRTFLQTRYTTGQSTETIGSSKITAKLCKQLCEAVNAFINVVSDDRFKKSSKDTQKKLNDAQSSLSIFLAGVNDFLTKYKDCEPIGSDGSGVVSRYKIEATQQASEISEALAAVTAINTKYDALVQQTDSLRALSIAPDFFQERYYIGPYTVPVSVTIDVQYTPLKEIRAPGSDVPAGGNNGAEQPKAKTLVKFKLNFGGDSRFVLSGGIAYGLLERNEFKSVLGQERDSQGNIIPGQTTPTNIIGFSEKMNRRVTPLLMLNTRLTNSASSNTDLYFSFGITGKSSTAGTDIEYLLGPSVNFLDRRVFFTYGLYVGKANRLNSGLFIGQKIDAATADAKLIRKDLVWKSGFAVTYRIR